MLTSDDPNLRRLAIMVLIRAAKDAQRGDTDAADWLRGGALPWAALVGWTQGQLNELLAQGRRRFDIPLPESGGPVGSWPVRGSVARALVIQAETARGA